MFEKIKRFFFWGWKLRNSVDFDCNTLYYMIYLKLDTVYNCMRDDSHLMWNSSEDNTGMKKLRIARELAKRIHEDKYLWNHFSFRDNPEELLGIEMLPRGLGRRTYNNYKRQDSQKKQEKELLFKLLEKHIDGWWD